MATTKQAFKTAYTGRERQITEGGRPEANEYGYTIDKFGRKVLVKTGETNLYAKIQESLEETKIENILARVTTGDTSMLRPDGIYADLTELPNNLIEARQAMQNLENVWNGLDNEIKKKYNFDVEEFIGASGTESWLRDMGLLEEKQTEVRETATKPQQKQEKETPDNE